MGNERLLKLKPLIGSIKEAEFTVLTTTEFLGNLGAVCDACSSGERFIVTRYGQDSFMVGPPDDLVFVAESDEKTDSQDS